MKKIFKLTFILSIMFLVMSIFPASASSLGYVVETDIVTFIDYSPIQSYNYKNKTYVIAEELANYGFDVVWDNSKRELRIDRKEYNFTPYISDFVNQKKENVTFKNLFEVYPTDIKTYVNGELAEAYNIFGRTIVNIDFMYHWGNCIYDDSARRYEVRILEKEIEETEEKIAGENESVTETQKGVFKDSVLSYGMKKTVVKTRFGERYTYIFGDFENGKTIEYSSSYEDNYTGQIKYNMPGTVRVNCYGDEKNPSYTTYFTQNSSVYADGNTNFKFGVLLRSIMCNDSEGYEIRYLPENGQIYLIKEKNSDELSLKRFKGQLFKDGILVYKGDIYHDELNLYVNNTDYFQTQNVIVLYAPGYTDNDGVIYYYSNDPDAPYKNDSIYYRGNVVNGVAHGNGKLYYVWHYPIADNDFNVKVYDENRQISYMNSEKENVMYSGDFFNGLMNGKGTMYMNSLPVVKGTWLNGLLNGYGELFNDNSTDSVYPVYKGEFKDGKKHGQGIEYASRGNVEFEGVYQRFVGEFNLGSWYNGKWYELKYNADTNSHDIYLYYEGEVRFDGSRQYGTFYEYYNEETGQVETKTGYFVDWKIVQ